MPRFVAVYTMMPEDVVAFRARPRSAQEAIDRAGIADAQNQIADFVIVEAAAAGLFQHHPHINVFPGDGIDVMPDVTGPPLEQPS